MKARDLTGMRFGRLVVTELAPSMVVSGRSRRHWRCSCDCGEVVTVIALALISGGTKSCGCFRLDRITTHGMTGTPEYRSWRSMLQRCMNVSSNRYMNYGGRGISVCDRWMDFANFFSDMGSRPSLDYSLDRIDNDGNYEPGNCRWATRSEQQRNKRRPNTENAVRGDRHWTRTDPERARAIASKNIQAAHGRLENNPNSKLTHQLAQLLRDTHKSNPKMTLTELGAIAGVGRETARKVIRGISW